MLIMKLRQAFRSGVTQLLFLRSIFEDSNQRKKGMISHLLYVEMGCILSMLYLVAASDKQSIQ